MPLPQISTLLGVNQLWTLYVPGKANPQSRQEECWEAMLVEDSGVPLLSQATGQWAPEEHTIALREAAEDPREDPWLPWDEDYPDYPFCFGTENKGSVLAQFSHTLPRPPGLGSGHLQEYKFHQTCPAGWQYKFQVGSCPAPSEHNLLEIWFV